MTTSPPSCSISSTALGTAVQVVEVVVVDQRQGIPKDLRSVAVVLLQNGGATDH
jgi:hypothetical protein